MIEMHKVEWNLYFVADYRRSCVTRVDPNFVDLGKTRHQV